MAKKVDVNDGEVKVDLEDGDESNENLFKPGSTMDTIVKRDKSAVKKSNTKLGVVPDKFVKDLTTDERVLLEKNFLDGIENDNFNVKRLKSGNISITRKRSGKVKTIDDAVVKSVSGNGFVNGGSKITNEQMMIGHLIDIEKKLEKERLKRKRLQKKYRKIKNDIYEDSGNGEDEIIINHSVERDSNEKEEDKVVEKPVEDKVIEKPIERVVEPEPKNNFIQPKQTIQRKMTVREMLLLRVQNPI